jgi:hypothetical protein
MQLYFCAFAVCVGLLIPLAGRGEPIDGPETAGLIDSVKGWIITDDTGDITALSLPERKSHVVFHPQRTADGMGPTVHSISGPDEEGRVAYVLDYFFVDNDKEERHLLKTVQLDGTGDAEIFSRPGSAMWATSAAGNGEIGSHLALAPTGARVAFLSQTVSRQMPEALLTLGNIEIWNVKDKTGHDTKVVALDEPMSWFPDGQRLAYSTLVKRDELPPDAGGLKQFGNYYGNAWDELPAIFIYDVNAKESTFFHVGWQPVVSADGESVLVGGYGVDDFHWVRANSKTGQSTEVALPGAVGAVIGTNADLTCYVGLPAEGAEIKFTENNSPLRGPKEMLVIKVSNDSGEKFQTLVPYIDPRSQASFGSAK